MITFREGDRMLHIDEDYLVCLWRMVRRGELVEQKHGYWLPVTVCQVYKCSLCNNGIMTRNISVYKYCPECGAKMHGVKE